MPLTIQNRQRKIPIDTARLAARLQQVLRYLGQGEAELSVVLANDRFLRTLNRTYRHRDRPTNVLAFPQHTPGTAVPGAAHLLGDVVVSLPTAAREARDLGRPLETHVLALLVHGTLHLLGYDHEGSEAEHRRMAAREHDILEYLHQHPPDAAC